ncbi:helix-turn-helix domain-containing protein [Pontimicrobium sp. MEBiC06410]
MIKNPYSIFLILFLLFLKIGKAQVVTETEVEALRSSLIKYYKNDREKVIPSTKKFISMSKAINKEEYILEGYGTLILMYTHINKMDSILYFHEKALQHCSKPKDSVRFILDLAKTYEKRNMYMEAIEQVHLGLNIAELNGIDNQIEKIDKDLDFLRYKVFDLKREGLEELKKQYKLAKENGAKQRIKYIRLYLIQRQIEHKQANEAIILIEEGLADISATNNHKFLYDFYLLKTKAYILKQEERQAKIAMQKALAIAKNEDLGEYVFSEVKYEQAKIYGLQKDYKNQVIILEEILKKDITYSPYQLRDYYELLKEAYEQLNDIELYKNYSKKYEEEVKKIQKIEKESLVLSHFLKEDITNNEKEKQKKQKKILGIASFLLLIVLVLMFYKYKSNKKENQELFEILMLRIKDHEENRVKLEEALKHKELNTVKREQVEPPKNDLKEQEEPLYVIDDEKVNEILLKLKKLESQKYFLRQDCTLHNMAKKLKTNTSYLSKIVNKHLNKTFSAYINELRINYAIIELKHNKQLRAYSTKAIAQELGYKKAASFTKYFKEATGITPVVYIKKIKELT